jgi:hypothetical protein
VLGHGVGGTGGAAAQTRLGGGVDDRALALGEHVRQGGSGQQERRGEVDADEPLPLGVGDIGGGAHAVHDPGVVDQDVQAAEGRDGGGHDLIHHVLLAQVTGHRDGRAACRPDLLRHGLGAPGVEVGDQDLGALAGEPQSRGPAYAGTRAGDDDACVLQTCGTH